jgi:hypothetical protein
MTRRALFLLPLSALAEVRDTPYNRMALAANKFDEQHRIWAERLNVTHGQTLDARAVEAWEPLPKLWRDVEHLWAEWVRRI